MSDKNLSSAMRNAEASVRMEDFEVTPKMREQCRRVLDGEITTTAALMQLLNERECQNLRDALASIHMEGFEVTEQTAKDCIRLMRGKVSVEELVDEILIRPTNVL